MKKRKAKTHSVQRVRGLPADAELIGSKDEDLIYRDIDGNWYLVREEPTVYKIAAAKKPAGA